MSSTVSQLISQWENPSDVTTVLMVIGGDVVQKALAQTTGCWYTPVCFSFGWVAYTFMALVGVMGDGRLLPPPDYPVKVFNLGTGYVRDNKNWVIGRLLRDHETYISRKEPADAAAIRITVWQAEDNVNRQAKFSVPYSRIHVWGIATTITQLVIAAIPLILDGRWGILFITGYGTLLALLAGALPQWRAEKLPNRQESDKTFALTQGNGSKDIMVIFGAGKSLDLEDLSAQETPRSTKPWTKFRSDYTHSAQHIRTRSELDGKFLLGRMGSFQLFRIKLYGMLAGTMRGLPVGFLITLVVCVVQSILWLLLLITVAALSTDTWYLILVGGIGMFQNGYLAAMERTPKHRKISLACKEVITMAKVMDGLMDLEAVYGRKYPPSDPELEPLIMPLVNEFFPGRLLPDENDWWSGNRSKYDDKRIQQKERRMFPRSRLFEGRTASFGLEHKEPRKVYGKEQLGPKREGHHASEKSQSGGFNRASHDWGSNLDGEHKHDREAIGIGRPTSPQQTYQTVPSRFQERIPGDDSIGMAFGGSDGARTAQHISSSSSTQPQMLQITRLGRPYERSEGGYLARPPEWS